MTSVGETLHGSPAFSTLFIRQLRCMRLCQNHDCCHPRITNANRASYGVSVKKRKFKGFLCHVLIYDI